jgi:sRNA-binding protein
MHEGIAQLAELYPDCFRRPRQPLKIGIHNDIIAQHPELRASLIAIALKTYTRSLGYLEMLGADRPRGQPGWHGHGGGREDAQRKIAKAARRAAAMASEGGKSAGPPSAKPVAKRAGQQNPISEANSQQPTPAQPQRLGLADLKASAEARRARLVAAK